MSEWQSSTTDGIHAIRRDGVGSPVVILPGVMADATTWQPVADALALDHPVIVINRRGRAPSRDLGADYTVGIEVEDLTAVLARVGEPVHLFGWSYGGLIATDAVAGGLAVHSLTAYEPVSRPFAPEAIAPIRAALDAGDPDRAVEIVNIDVSGFDSADVSLLRSTPTWSKLCQLAAPLADELAAIDRFYPDFARYAAIDVPVTLIVGALNEGTAPYGDAFQRFADAIPSAVIDRMAGVGHLAHVDAPQTLARHIGQAIIRAETAAD